MNELLDAALRMMAPSHGPAAGEDLRSGGLPALVPYADYERRYEPAASMAAVTHASAVAHLLRLSRALETLHGFAVGHGPRSAAPDSDHLYQAHGDPRD